MKLKKDKIEKRMLIGYITLTILLLALIYISFYGYKKTGKAFEIPRAEKGAIGTYSGGFFSEKLYHQTIPKEIIKAYSSLSKQDKQSMVQEPGNILEERYRFVNKIDTRLLNSSFLRENNYVTSQNRIKVIVLFEKGKTFSSPVLIKKRDFRLIDGVSAEVSQNDLNLIAASSNVKGIYLNERVQLPEPLGEIEDISALEEDNRNELINSNAAWSKGYNGNGIKIAILDTGVDKNHPDLAGRVIAEESFVEGYTPADGHGHGTHVASLAAGSGIASNGKYKGVAFNALIMNGKVLDDQGSGYDDEIIAGIEWAIDNGADIISMSLGGTPTGGLNAPLTEAVNRAFERGVVMVIAAGNSGWY